MAFLFASFGSQLHQVGAFGENDYSKVMFCKGFTTFKTNLIVRISYLAFILILFCPWAFLAHLQ